MQKYFCGQYDKCQSDTQTLAVISAVHGGSRSVQLITDGGAWNFTKSLDGCRFGGNGFTLDLHENGVRVEGSIQYGALRPIRYDIMGPFRYLPFLQCRHSIVSMRHRVEGEIRINGTPYGFHDALGYIEGDRGRSFPREYLWTQTFFGDGSLMLSVAEIPLGAFHFTGVIGVILWQGKEYRLATYLGARAVKIGDGAVVVRQGDYTFSARLVEKSAHSLSAPVDGAMVRTIHENAACRAVYCLEQGSKTLFAFETDRASFEFEYGGKT